MDKSESLFNAVREQNILDVRSLITEKVDVNKSNAAGLTPLHLAVDSEEIVTELIKAGAEVDAKDHQGNTPLHSSVWIEHNSKILKILINHGADVDCKNLRGETPLHCAAESSNRETIEYLLSRGAQVNARDRLGRTPLHVVARLNDGVSHLEEAEVLLRYGADVGAKNNEGTTPLQLLVVPKQSNAKILELFLNHVGGGWNEERWERLELKVQEIHDGFKDLKRTLSTLAVFSPLDQRGTEEICSGSVRKLLEKYEENKSRN